MPRRPRIAAFWLALAFLLPLAAVDSCDDCLWEAAADCCPSSCCLCCFQNPSALAASIASAPSRVDAGSAAEPAPDGSLFADPRDVFHVPKTSLA